MFSHVTQRSVTLPARIQPPETFDFSTPNEWPKWRKRFERYLVVSGMKKKEEADKIDLVMYLMGDRADDIFRTFKFEKEEEATKIDSVLKAFDSHFCVRKNIIYERAKFNSRIQEDREPVDEFITSLYKLADSCEFEGLHEQLIRDRIVVGVRDKALSERMQLDSELTLEKAVKMVRQQEAVRQQQVDLQRPSTSQKVNQVKFNSKKQSPKQQQQPSRKKEKSPKTRSRCPKCGDFTHREGQACRAEGQRCNLCSKTGHFANCCPDKQAKTAEVKAVSELDEEIGLLLEVSAVEDSSNLDDDEGECRRRWTAEIQVNGKKVKFKLDSQADVTCVPLCLFKNIMGQQRLVKSDINLRAAEFSELQTVGMFISTLRNGNYEIKEKIYVIRRLSEPLLSRRACELLNLARRIEVVATRINPIKEFPEVFEGLGQIGNPYEIKLKPGAKPYAVHTPRRVPIPLMEKLKTRLEELEKAGIIAQVNVATEWCAPTVIAGKSNGDIRLCVDLSRLNEHVQREVHPMPVVEHMLGQLGEARFFSKLDANSGFHQIPLSPDCQHLTTFITPFGRYKYCRMPFGISLAPEYFQRVMSIILQGMDGVMCYLDDILIFASDSKTHDRILRLVLRKLKEAKVTLNKAKCVFGVPRINFLGHLLDEDGIRPDPAKIEAVAKMPAPTDVHGVRRFLGMVNHLGRFVGNLSEIVAPLNQLLVKGQDFVWDSSQERAFRKLKELLTTQPILAAYDVRKPTMVSSDASSYGLGAVLKQEDRGGSSKSPTVQDETLANLSTSPDVLLPTLRVTLKGNKTEKTARAIIDTGSQRSYISHSTAMEMEYEQSRREYFRHSLFGGSSTDVVEHEVYTIHLSDINNSYRCEFEALGQPLICGSMPPVCPRSFLEGNEELNVSDLMRDRIEVLIGADIAGRLLTDVQRRISSGLVAIRTKLGWTVMGKIPLTEVQDKARIPTNRDTLTIGLEDFELIVPTTKRNVLSIVSKIFDPLGVACPVTLISKLILQETWTQKLTWDEVLPGCLVQRFWKWFSKLKHLPDIEIPRWLCFKDSYVEKTTLHIFCDASQFAYATCIFLRIEKEDRVGIQLIQARTRVAPLKKLTIPILELLVCLIGARLAANVIQDLKTVKKIINQCIRCKRFTATPATVESTSLPEDRVRDAAVFEIVGVDLTGHLILKNKKKAWIVIFTCAVYRGVYLELVTSLSMEAFLQAFRRFIARRGRPLIVYSDDGTNFKGMANTLKKIDFSRLKCDPTLKNITWKFIPPGAPWWGGWWERLIGTMKQLLFRILGQTSLGYEELSTVMCDVESLMNTRPLTYLTEESEDLAPLTPSLFLHEVREVGVPDLDLIDNQTLSRKYQYIKRVRDLRERFRIEYLGFLRQGTRRLKTTIPFKVGNMVLIGQESLKRLHWPLARIIQLYPEKDGLVRVAKVKTSSVRSGADPVPWISVYFSTYGGSGFCWDDVEGSAPDTIGLVAVGCSEVRLSESASKDDLPSPAQCLFSRRTRTVLPTSTHQLEPEIQKGHTQNLRNKREKQKTHHDKTAKTTRSFKEGEKIMLKQHHREWIPARFTQEVAPRSYKVQTPTGEYCRNSSFMRHTNLESPKQQRRRIPEIPKSTLPEGPGPSGDKEQAQVPEELNTSSRTFSGQEPRRDHQNAEHKNGTLPITT
ncbi:hypothetical protein LAZ67_5002467, partial [Cordylochernes scorpioides]